MNEEGIKRNVIVIGTSAGGVSALQQLCAALPADFPRL
jgi:chemotaxis response regulator CheB